MNQTAMLTPIRRHDVDWLKVLFLYLLFAFQVSRVFEAELNSRGSSGILSQDFNYIGFFISQWYMPFVFLVSGWSRKNAMQSRSGISLLRERLLRLIIPFATGFVLLVPLYFYEGSAGILSLGRQRTSGVMHLSLLNAVPVIFNRTDTFAWSYLLFLFYLFAFTILTWPFFTWLMTRKVTPLKISRVWVYLPIVPLMLIQMSLGGYWPEERGILGNWVMLLYFIAYFILGFVVSRYNAYERAIHQEARYAGVLGLVLLIIILVTASNLPKEIFPIITPIASWCCAVGLLGLAKSYLDAPSTWLSYLLEASLPIFILHQVFIVLIASVMSGIMIGTSARFMGLLLVSLGVSIVFYHILVRRFVFTRIIFGMKVANDQVIPSRDQAFYRDHL